MYDSSSPAQAHGALSDIDQIRNNTNEVRKNEASAEASPPSNPVAGMDWHTSDTEKRYLRTNAGSWLFLYSVSDPPVRSSQLNSHTSSNITNSTTVHGIRQGPGNGFDADTLDSYHASYFLAATHATATSSVHGVGAGAIVGTTLAQTLTNKTLSSPTIQGGSITDNISVSAGKTVDGRDLSVDGAKLDTYPGNGAPADNTVTLSKLQLLQGSWSSTNSAGGTWQYSYVDLGAYAHSLKWRLVTSGGSPHGGQIDIGYYKSLSGWGDTGELTQIRVGIYHNEGGGGAVTTGYLWWYYHAN